MWIALKFFIIGSKISISTIGIAEVLYHLPIIQIVYFT